MEGGKIYSLLLLSQLMLIYKASCDECVHLYLGTYVYYNGTETRSVHGRECQRWDSTIGVPGFYFSDFQFKDDGSINAANNYCRDPYSYRDEIFCYTLNPHLTKELCSVAVCDDTSKEHMVTIDGEMMRCRIPPENGECDVDELYVCKDTYKVVQTKKKRNNCLELYCCTPKDCWEGPSNHYNGTWRHTSDGIPCRAWNSYLGSADPDPFNLPELSLDDAKNYCRDPDFTGDPWCYTDQRGFRGAFLRWPCAIPTCADYLARHSYDHDCYQFTDKDLELYQPSNDPLSICESVPGRVFLEDSSEKYLYPGCESCNCCQMKGCITGDGRNYTGTWSRTHNGRKCKSWNETTYQGKDELFPDKTVADAENYCRHTSDNSKVVLWCFTDDKYMEQERCDIPNCDDVIPSTVVSTTTENIPTTIIRHIDRSTNSKQTVALDETATTMKTTEIKTFQSTGGPSVPPLNTGANTRAIMTSGLITSPLFWMLHILIKNFF